MKLKPLAGGHTDRAIEAMDAQARWRTNPEVRADHFVAEWRHLRQRREKLEGWQHAEERDATEHRLSAMVRSIDKDPQMGAALVERASQLGLSREWSLEWSAGSFDGGVGDELQRSRGIARAEAHARARAWTGALSTEAGSCAPQRGFFPEPAGRFGFQSSSL